MTSHRTLRERIDDIADRVVKRAVKDDPTNPCPACTSALIFGPVRCTTGTRECLMAPGVPLVTRHHEYTCLRCGHGWIMPWPEDGARLERGGNDG